MTIVGAPKRRRGRQARSVDAGAQAGRLAGHEPARDFYLRALHAVVRRPAREPRG